MNATTQGDYHKPRRMRPYEVIIGRIGSIEDCEGDYIVELADQKLIVPAELGIKVKELVGKRVGIVHLVLEYFIKLETEAS